MKEAYDFLLAGVGGQGTILASDLLSDVGLAAGFDVKKSEVHGMAQRGGSVNTHVRWNRQAVWSPLIGVGEADVLLAFEKAEALRYAEFLRPRGTAIVNEQAIHPITVTMGGMHYPTDEELAAVYARLTPRLQIVPGAAIAARLGNIRAANVVLLGALSRSLDVPDEIWRAAIDARVPQRWRDLNQEAFQRGQEAVGEAT
jgi:indolepyruvate ferredoxin oxidoreductase beta subunit